ncbi:hypothetical protein NQZ68_025936 [Dissostichus eleginoides]|nr:hypothetical protein NQZ68_025936 [Dissostichus eleginoides]
MFEHAVADAPCIAYRPNNGRGVLTRMGRIEMLSLLFEQVSDTSRLLPMSRSLSVDDMPDTSAEISRWFFKA